DPGRGSGVPCYEAEQDVVASAELIQQGQDAWKDVAAVSIQEVREVVEVRRYEALPIQRRFLDPIAAEQVARDGAGSASAIRDVGETILHAKSGRQTGFHRRLAGTIA